MAATSANLDIAFSHNTPLGAARATRSCHASQTIRKCQLDSLLLQSAAGPGARVQGPADVSDTAWKVPVSAQHRPRLPPVCPAALPAVRLAQLHQQAMGAGAHRFFPGQHTPGRHDVTAQGPGSNSGGLGAYAGHCADKGELGGAVIDEVAG